MDSYEAGDQLGTLKAVKLWHHERFVDDVTGLIMEAKHNPHTMSSGHPVIVMIGMNHMGIPYSIIENPFHMNMVNPANMHCWWYEDITRIDQTQ
jgi:hypothetical protein